MLQRELYLEAGVPPHHKEEAGLLQIAVWYLIKSNLKALNFDLCATQFLLTYSRENHGMS
jgi:hypothetical protein